MKRGSKPKHPAVRALDGNPGKRPIIDVQIEALGAVFVPDHLSDDAQACIEHITRMMPPAVYAAVDSYGLACFAAAWAWHKTAVHTMAAPGFVAIVKGSSGQEAMSPWFKVLKLASEEMRSWGDRLGLSPAARMAIKMPAAEKPTSKFGNLTAPAGSRHLLSS